MDINFLTIVQVYQLEGLVALGKMLNPATNQITRSLEHAKYVVDLLDIIKSKTVGNLTDEEQRFLDNTISTLKLNYLEESGTQNAPPPAELV
ncbi:MAG: DUF1844 domain-containing protein [bacterium]|nr:DUF1844 domain-containing protein [bacterium]